MIRATINMFSKLYGCGGKLLVVDRFGSDILKYSSHKTGEKKNNKIIVWFFATNIVTNNAYNVIW